MRAFPFSFFHGKKSGWLLALQESTGRVYRSTDGGTSWSMIAGTGALPGGGSSRTGAIYVPVYNAIVAASGVGAVAYCSTDGGLTWPATGALATIASMFAASSDGANVLALRNASASAVSRSTDGGATWSSVSLGATLTWSAIANLPGTSTFLAVATGTATAKRSTNGGSSWATITPFGSTSANRWVCGVDANTAIISDGTTTGARSTDGGATWAPITFSVAALNGLYAVPGTQVVIGLGAGNAPYLTRSTDGGASWSTVTLSANAGAKSVAYDAGLNCILAASGSNGTAALRSWDLGATWESVTIPQCYQVVAKSI